MKKRVLVCNNDIQYEKSKINQPYVTMQQCSKVGKKYKIKHEWKACIYNSLSFKLPFKGKWIGTK